MNAKAPSCWLLRGASPAAIAEHLDPLRFQQDAIGGTYGDGPLTLALVEPHHGSLSAQAAIALRELAHGAPIALADHGIYFDPSPPGLASLTFLLPGQGSQYTGMLAGLSGVLPNFHAHLGALDDTWKSLFQESLLAVVHRQKTDAHDRELRDTRRAQPAIGLVSLAAARALEALGITPNSLAGHSYGELSSLAIARVLDDHTFLRLSEARGRLLGEAGDQAPGAMTAVFAPADVVGRLLDAVHGTVVVANHNAPDQVVLSGALASLEAVEANAARLGLRTVRLRTSCAFHSPLMAPVATRWRTVLDQAVFHPIGASRIVGNVTARPYAETVDALREGLERQITAPVRWVDSVEQLFASGARIFLEVGPGRVLSDLTARILETRSYTVLPLDPLNKDPRVHWAHLFARLASLGVPLNASPFGASMNRPPSAIPSPSVSTAPEHAPLETFF
ncbi:MAG: ACP S-malonyltransferase, partial [Myxococcales bacterium]